MSKTSTITLFFLFSLLQLNYALNDNITQRSNISLSQTSPSNQNANATSLTSQEVQKSNPRPQKQILPSQFQQNSDLGMPRNSREQLQASKDFLMTQIIDLFWMDAVYSISVIGMCILIYKLYKLIMKKRAMNNPLQQQNITQVNIGQLITT